MKLGKEEGRRCFGYNVMGLFENGTFFGWGRRGNVTSSRGKRGNVTSPGGKERKSDVIWLKKEGKCNVIG